MCFGRFRWMDICINILYCNKKKKKMMELKRRKGAKCKVQTSKPANQQTGKAGKQPKGTKEPKKK